MKSRLHHRPATPADLDPLLAMMQAFYAEDGIEFDAGRARRAVETLLRRPELGAILLLDDPDSTDQPGAHGFMVLVHGFTLEHGGLFVLLDELYLQPALRGCGLGREAIRLAREWASMQGAGAIRLEVHHHNAKAKALYAKHGFRDDHRDILTLWL